MYFIENPHPRKERTSLSTITFTTVNTEGMISVEVDTTEVFKDCNRRARKKLAHLANSWIRKNFKSKDKRKQNRKMFPEYA